MFERAVWDGLTAKDLAQQLGLPRVHVLDEVDSTLDVAHKLAQEDAPGGTLVVANHQRAGRGRLGRAWSSPAGAGVWSTLIERPAEAAALDVLSLRVGLEVAERLDAIARAIVHLKWPNDLMVASHQSLVTHEKLGGVLVEAKWAGKAFGWVAIGVGVNVAKPADQPAAAGLPAGVRRLDVLAAVVAGVRAAAARGGHLDAGELMRFAARDALAGTRIVQPLAGVAAGIAADGALLVDTPRGTQQCRTGTIRMAEDS